MVEIRVIVNHYCPKCNAILYRNNRNEILHFGPQLERCKKCGYLCKNPLAVELATKPEDKVREYCKDSMIDKANGYAVMGAVLIITIVWLLFPSFENAKTTTQAITLLVCGILSFAVKCLVIYVRFWRVDYKDSVERMNDPDYLKLLKDYNQNLSKNGRT